MTKAEIKQRAKHVKLKVRKGDKVLIIAGKDKGQIGTIYAVSPKEMKVIVLADNAENPEQPLPLNVAVKHRKARQQGERGVRRRIPKPRHNTNLNQIHPSTNQPTRVGRRVEDGKLVRYGKKSGNTIPEPDYKL